MTIDIFGLEVRLLFVSEETGVKLILTAGLVASLLVVRWLLRAVVRMVLRGIDNERARFWSRQAVNLGVAALLLVGLLSVWFDDPTRLATGIGLVTAGLAFALQRVITAVAGYFVILRGDTFNVGDRITMGGVRGDVIALGFIKTTIMEMGQPPAVQDAAPAQWVKSRQYTGRVVTVSNGRVFDEPVYNFTRDFPYLWEEMTLPIMYRSDRHAAEEILLEAAVRYAVKVDDMPTQALEAMRRKYFLQGVELEPKVYWRLTDNALELTVRFLTELHGIRDVKDQIAREVLHRLEDAGIGIATASYEIVGLPPVRVSSGDSNADGGAR
ncbi:mechanosensitive ion channel family protein [Mycobacterium sp. IDR2000157661]|uniref:mechanosensitive ion channel family protein n=1 Tax=Mycobacterium sp. IDR2000157661 TaxID=2867005 RepID=UPI001EEBDF94|nr:mechanosensitive ion channel domain-containing protein [Mycobacterium sp. IDR2000157661]ULE33448.1 mechanosensitive ion channel family protein [Mycobacterium sp. IDR2000157661]